MKILMLHQQRMKAKQFLTVTKLSANHIKFIITQDEAYIRINGEVTK